MKYEHTEKLKPLKGKQWDYWDHYRGNVNINWNFADSDVRDSRPITLFSGRCVVCGKWWGWSFNLSAVEKMVRIMTRVGCPRCAKRGKAKKQKRLRKELER